MILEEITAGGLTFHDVLNSVIRIKPQAYRIVRSVFW